MTTRDRQLDGDISDRGANGSLGSPSRRDLLKAGGAVLGTLALGRGALAQTPKAGGSIISGAVVRNSLLFSAVRIEERSQVERSVIMPGVHIGRDCIIRNAIIDEHCDIPNGTLIGVDPVQDRERFDVTPRGVVLVTPETLRAATVTRVP